MNRIGYIASLSLLLVFLLPLIANAEDDKTGSSLPAVPSLFANPVECKTYSEGNCMIKACTDGQIYKSCSDPTANPTTMVNCKTYIEGDCTFKVCTDGYYSKSCDKPQPRECKTYEDGKNCKITVCTDGSQSVTCPDIPQTCIGSVDAKTGCITTSCPNGMVSISCPEVTVKPDECTVTREGDCLIKKCSSGYYNKVCEAPDNKTTECKSYMDGNGCKVVACTNGYNEIYCEKPPECKQEIKDNGCIVSSCGPLTSESCPKDPDSVTCKVYEDGDCKIKECSDGTISKSCDFDPGSRTCKSYMDEKGCKVVACTDGSTEYYCGDACSKSVDEKGCVTTICGDATSYSCPTKPAIDLVCKEYEQNGCKIKECSDGSISKGCKIDDGGISVPVACKVSIDKEGCQLSECPGGAISRTCYNNWCENVDCKEGYTCMGGACVQKCKEVVTGSCTYKYCTNGYEEKTCQDMPPLPEDPECKTYEDEGGCKIKVCSDGTTDKSCPKEEDNCKVFKDDSGCKVKVCEDGRKKYYCEGGNVLVEPAVAVLKIGEGKQRAEVDIEKTDYQTMVTVNNKNFEITIRKVPGSPAIVLKTPNAQATTTEEVKVQESKLLVKNKEVGVSPEEADEKFKSAFKVSTPTAGIRLIDEGGVLKYVGSGKKKGNLLFFIPVEYEIRAEVDASNGNVRTSGEPFYAFMVS
ncbi:MAG: hypothetical protein AABX01_03570 [Candidatus Micrarchaeota archaeon]